MNPRRSIQQVRHRSRLSRVGRATTPGGLGRPGANILAPRDFSIGSTPGTYQTSTPVLGAHTHDHSAILLLGADDHTQYALRPRTKWRDVAPAGAPYSDPRAAIQACAAGEGVRIGGGTYPLTSSIVVPADDISIVGVGREAVLFDNTSAGAQIVIDVGARNGVEIQGLSLATAAGNNASGAISVNGGDDLRIMNVGVDSADLARGISVTNSDRSKVIECYLYGDFDYAVYFDQADYFRLLWTIILNAEPAPSYGIFADDSDDVVIAFNHIELTNAASSTSLLYNRDCYRTSMVGNVGRATNCGANNLIVAYANTVSAAENVFAHNILEDVNGAGRGINATAAVGFTLDDLQIVGNRIINAGTSIRLANARVQNPRVYVNGIRGSGAIVDASVGSDVQHNM